MSEITSLGRYFEELGEPEILSKDKFDELFIRYKETGDREAYDAMIRSLLKFGIYKASKFSLRARLPLEDLVAIANLTIVESIERYDPEKNAKPTTYINFWLKAAFISYFNKNYSVNWLSTNAYRKLATSLSTFDREFQQENNRPPTIEEIAKHFGFEPEVVIAFLETRNNVRRTVSLDVPLYEHGKRTVQDIVPHPTNPLALILKGEAEKNTQRIIDFIKRNLDQRDLLIFTKRIIAEDPLTLEQLGDELGITRERVRQIEKELYKKIKLIVKRSPLFRELQSVFL